MYKVFESTPYFPQTNEPTVQLLGGDSAFEKTAAYKPHHNKEIDKYMRGVKAEDGFSYLLILALGSSEYYGCNRNGDWFDEPELIDGFGTFESGPAYLYRHHQNKDPKAALGKVVKAFWNSEMHRVEIVVRLDNKKAPDVVEKLIAGAPVATSMGCRVKFDVCSECGNRASSRTQYCDHLRHEMRNIRDDGRQVYAINRIPTFFDISLVFRPADRTSYVLRKIASETEEFYEDAGYGPTVSSAELGDVQEKIAALRKISDISKIIRGIPIRISGNGIDKSLIENYRERRLPSLVQGFEHLGGGTLDGLSKSPGVVTIRVLRDNGLSLSTPEMCKITIARKTGSLPSDIPSSYGRIISMMMPFILDLLSSRSDVVSRVTSEDPEFHEKSGEEGWVNSLIEEFPVNRYFDDRSLMEKSAEHTKFATSWFGAVQAWRELGSLDGPARQQTIKMRLPDGKIMVIPREEILNAQVLDYASTTNKPWTALTSVPKALTALAVGTLLPGILPSSDKADLPMSGKELWNHPGIRGQIKKASNNSGLGIPGVINTLAIDHCINEGHSCGREVLMLKNASYERIIQGLDRIILKNLCRIGL